MKCHYSCHKTKIDANFSTAWLNLEIEFFLNSSNFHISAYSYVLTQIVFLSVQESE